MNWPYVDLHRSGDISFLRLCRTDKANALDDLVTESMHSALDALETDGTRLLVLQGEGKHFCAGFDFGSLEASSDGDLLRRFVRIELVLQRLYHAPFTTLALAQGAAMGAGADLFCACGVRAASPDATFRLPGWRFGIALGTRRLIARVGVEWARHQLMTSAPFSAAAALQVGFATKMAEISEWDRIVSDTWLEVERLSPVAQRDLLKLTVTDTCSEDLSALVRSASRPGLKERIAGFLVAERAERQAPSARRGDA